MATLPGAATHSPANPAARLARLAHQTAQASLKLQWAVRDAQSARLARLAKARSVPYWLAAGAVSRQDQQASRWSRLPHLPLGRRSQVAAIHPARSNLATRLAELAEKWHRRLAPKLRQQEARARHSLVQARHLLLPEMSGHPTTPAS